MTGEGAQSGAVQKTAALLKLTFIKYILCDFTYMRHLNRVEWGLLGAEGRTGYH